MTTNADVMAELIGRLEGLTEGSREVDAEIAVAVGIAKSWKRLEGWREPALIETNAGGAYPLPYTSSVDAALTLVPPHHQWSGGSCNEDDQPWACVTGPESEGCVDFDGDGANEAIALLIAIFKALTAQASAASVGTGG